MKFYHVSNSKNLNSIIENGLIAQVGERSHDCNEALDAVFLFNSLEEMETALGSWLGDEFDEDDELIIIEIEMNEELASKLELVYQPEFYESYTLKSIPSTAILQIRDELYCCSFLGETQSAILYSINR